MGITRRRNRASLTQQIADELTKAIQEGQYPAGERLPSVERLALELGISRSTVREALRVLQAQGLVEVFHGLGIFASRQRITRSSGRVFSYSEVIRERGETPSSRVLHQEITIASAEVAVHLRITQGDRVNLIRRLRFANELPMAIETTISPYHRFPELLNQDWNGDASLYGFLQDRYGVIPQTATQIVRVVQAGHDECVALMIRSRDPILLVETVAYDQDGIPIEFGRSYYRADRYEYRVHLKHERDSWE